MGDSEDTNAGSGSEGNVMPDCVSAGDPDVANILNEEASLMVNEAGDAPEALGDAQVETGKDGDEQIEELETEGSLSEEGLVYTTECVTLEQFLQHVLQHLNINTDVWIKTDNNNFWQVTFVVESDSCESILQRLTTCGFGRFADTSITLFPASLHFVNRQSSDVTGGSVAEEVGKDMGLDSEDKNEFLSSIKSRLTVAQVVEDVKSHALLTFDYILLIILAR
ncbi:hypothetical protein LSAT2_016906 [Lamellibrachia satsuma]|nr:hypothetical protein LSAT2_016906 [Lamellibrachia satsuma]